MINKDISTIKTLLRDSVLITSFSIFSILIFDLLLTKIYGPRGFSKFFESNQDAGFINKREFVGRFGGPLDDFSNKISIDSFGNRKVISRKCNLSGINSENRNLVFVGDSMTAGFEVKDNEHYVSRISENCISNGLIINGGVRAHDTHMAAANAVRILKEFNLDQLNTVIVYGFSSNDFTENDNKNSYPNMKARFGSIFDQENYKPRANLNYLRLRMFVADNFYFTTKLIRQLELNNRELKLKASKIDKKSFRDEFNSEKCERVISILDATFSSKSIKSKVFLFVHPDFLNFTNLEETKLMENCLISATIDHNQISILPILSFINTKGDKFNYQEFIFKRDGHYSPKGHLFISEILLPKLESALSKNN